VQQLLAAMWYDGLPGFRRKSPVTRLIEVGKLGAMFPINSFIYMMAPNSKRGQFMTKPFVKFISHSASYAFFLSKNTKNILQLGAHDVPNLFSFFDCLGLGMGAPGGSKKKHLASS
jgi:hypothetical protein